MFLHLSVSHSDHGVCVCHTPPGRHPPLGRHPPWADTPQGRHPPAQCMLGYTPPAQYMLGYTPPLCSACWDTVNKRAVRILLECILVFNAITIHYHIFCTLSLQERNAGDCKRYNEIIRHETLRVAVCDMLDNNVCQCVEALK